MKLKLLFLALILPFLVQASSIYTYHVSTASTNLAATFPAIPQLSGPPTAFAFIQIYNGSATEIEVNCAEASQPSSNAIDSIFVPPTTLYPGTSTSPLVVNTLGKYCWLRSTGSTISSGTIWVTGWGY